MKLLVVVDMQNDFIGGPLGTPEAASIVAKVRKKLTECRAAGYTVVFTRDTHTQDYLNTQEGRLLPVVHCVKGTPGWEITGALPVEDSLVLDKPAFGSIALAQYAASLPGLERILLVGLCTDICVISNAMILKAALPEVEIAVDAACCAGTTPESHQNALAAMKMCQIQVV
ncbi:MAG TPA: cysteine hydrolase [Candidatus Faecousia faecigallinarum]|nr:cysteine hydrolase [Candidatus Faecousia faecigallinarum]